MKKRFAIAIVGKFRLDLINDDDDIGDWMSI